MENKATATDGTGTFGIDWKNVNLKSPFEASRNLLENYTFDTLLLEVHCNLPTINEQTVKAQAMTTIRAKYEEAIETLNNNLSNITKHAQKERNRK